MHSHLVPLLYCTDGSLHQGQDVGRNLWSRVRGSKTCAPAEDRSKAQVGTDQEASFRGEEKKLRRRPPHSPSTGKTPNRGAQTENLGYPKTTLWDTCLSEQASPLHEQIPPVADDDLPARSIHMPTLRHQYAQGEKARHVACSPHNPALGTSDGTHVRRSYGKCGGMGSRECRNPLLGVPSPSSCRCVLV